MNSTKKKFALVLCLSVLMLIPLARGAGPVIVCGGLAGNASAGTLLATVGGYSSAGSIIHATVDWGDKTADISTVSADTSVCPSGTTFLGKFYHTYAPNVSQQTEWFNVTTSLMDSSGMSTATSQLFYVLDAPASSGGGGRCCAFRL